jgi:hypothetical protein
MEKIAFIITVYKNDKLDFFKQAVESMVNQDYGFEHINIYLGIDGDLPDEIQIFIAFNIKLFHKVVQNETNKGLAFTLNKLIEVLEDEEYIFRMDSDDISKLDRVSKQVQALEEDKDLMLVGSDLIEIDENGNELRYKKMPAKMNEIIHFSIARSPFNHPTVAMRKSFFDIVGLYNEKLLKSQDYELWARALMKGIKVANINEVLVCFRVLKNFNHKRNLSDNYLSEFKISISLIKYFHAYGEFSKVLIKLFIRMMPSFIGKIAYKIVRENIK